MAAVHVPHLGSRIASASIKNIIWFPSWCFFRRWQPTWFRRANMYVYIIYIVYVCILIYIYIVYVFMDIMHMHKVMFCHVMSCSVHVHRQLLPNSLCHWIHRGERWPATQITSTCTVSGIVCFHQISGILESSGWSIRFIGSGVWKPPKLPSWDKLSNLRTSNLTGCSWMFHFRPNPCDLRKNYDQRLVTRRSIQ